MAANIFLGTTDSNYGTAANWSLLAVPTNVDGNVATFNATSPNCTVNTAARFASNISFNGYTNTITMSQTLTVNGTADFTGLTGAQVTGASALIINATSAITGGGTWGGALSFSVSSTKTITGTLTVTGLFTSSTTTQTINGGTLVLNGGLTNTGAMTGSTQVNLSGGTWSGAGGISNPLQLSSCTVSGSVISTGSTITYGSGTVTTTGSTLTCTTAATTFNCSSITWNNITIQITNCTLSADLNLGTAGTFGVNLAAANINGAFNINCGSNFTLSGTTVLSGAPKVVMTGAGTITIGSGGLSLSIDINATGVIVFTGTCNINTGTIKYVTAAGVTTTGSTLACSTNTTFQTAGITWNNITLSGASKTFTLNNALTGTGTLTISATATTTFTGAFDITCGSFTVSSSGAIITMSGNINSSGTVSTGAATSTTFNGAFNINASGSVTVGTSWAGTATLNYTGTGTFAGATSAAILSLNTTINTAGATFSTGFNFRTNSFTITALGTSTFSSFTFHISTGSPTLTVNSAGFAPTIFQSGTATNITVTGTNGFTMGTYNCSAGVSKITWKNSRLYTITAGISVVTTLALAMVWVSDIPGTMYTMTLQQGATNDVGFASITDADNSAGRTMWVYKGTISNCLNIKALPTAPMTVSSGN